jgi:DNA-directed RNA polymerase subunit RPC12/RpoP
MNEYPEFVIHALCGRKVYLTQAGIDKIANDKVITCPHCLKGMCKENAHFNFKGHLKRHSDKWWNDTKTPM